MNDTINLKNNCDIRRQLARGNSIDRYIGQRRLVPLFVHPRLVGLPCRVSLKWTLMWLCTMYGTLPGSFPFVDEVRIGSFTQRLNRHKSKNALGSEHNGPDHCLRDQRPTRLTSPEDQQPIRPTPTYQSRDPSTAVSDPSRDRGPSRMPVTLLHRMPRVVMNVA